MRDIEFRGKRKADGKWVYGFYYKKCGRHIILGDIMPDSDMQREFEVIPETVGEFTSLPDKKSKRIYENDIARTELGRLGIVRFSHGMFGIEWINYIENQDMVGSWGQLHNLRRMDDGFNGNVEIIGNIHDNPELLEAKP